MKIDISDVEIEFRPIVLTVTFETPKEAQRFADCMFASNQHELLAAVIGAMKKQGVAR